MHPKLLIDQLDEARIVAAIKRAELTTTGEIRVTVAHGHPVDALWAARTYFLRSGMNRIPQRNGVLIYFAPRAQTFAIWGDINVHEKCGNAFWREAITRISLTLKAGRLTQAVEEAVRDVGEVLARHFPRPEQSPAAINSETESRT